VRVVGVFPSGTHAPIVYPAALTMTAAPQAGRLAEFLTGEEARATFQRYGFVTFVPKPRGK